MSARKKLLSPAAVVEAWNAKHPIGTRVRYWPLRPTSSVLPIETRTRTVAYLMSKGADHASVMVEGVTGSVNLSTHVDVLDESKVAEPKPAPAVASRAPFCRFCYGFGFVWEGLAHVECKACGALQAAIAQAREEGAEQAIAYIALRMAKAAETGDISAESAEEFDDIVAAYRLKAEAAKGCAE